MFVGLLNNQYISVVYSNILGVLLNKINKENICGFK